MIETTVDYTIEKFLITNEPVMELAMKVLEVLNKIGKITISGKDESCPTTVSVANIITQNVLKGTTKTEKISLGNEMSDDGRMISTIEIMITKIGD
jgi:DNA-binding protein